MAMLAGGFPDLLTAVNSATTVRKLLTTAEREEPVFVRADRGPGGAVVCIKAPVCAR
jgi:hypothetical protein